jgi:hypothetical protein
MKVFGVVEVIALLGAVAELLLSIFGVLAEEDGSNFEEDTAEREDIGALIARSLLYSFWIRVLERLERWSLRILAPFEVFGEAEVGEDGDSPLVNDDVLGLDVLVADPNAISVQVRNGLGEAPEVIVHACHDPARRVGGNSDLLHQRAQIALPWRVHRNPQDVPPNACTPPAVDIIVRLGGRRLRQLLRRVRLRPRRPVW